MKNNLKNRLIIGLLISFPWIQLWAQSNEDILKLLVKQNIINQHIVDSLKQSSYSLHFNLDSGINTLLVSQNLHLNGYTQVRYQGFSSPMKNDAFDLHHARFILSGGINPHVNYYVQTDFEGTSGFLLDAYGDIHILSFFNLMIGQQKVALSRENQEIDNVYDFIDRTQVVNALVARQTDVIGNQNGRDIGIQAYGTFSLNHNRKIGDYWIGVYNGTGINVSDNNNYKDLGARLVLYPIAGLVIGGSIYRGEDFFNTTGIASGNHARNREGLEIKYTLTRFYIQAEYLRGNDAKIDRYGYYAEFGYYILSKKLELLGRWDVYDPNKSILHDHSNILFGGLDYSFNQNVRLQTGYNYSRNESGNPNGTPNSNYINAQLTLEF